MLEKKIKGKKQTFFVKKTTKNKQKLLESYTPCLDSQSVIIIQQPIILIDC